MGDFIKIESLSLVESGLEIPRRYKIEREDKGNRSLGDSLSDENERSLDFIEKDENTRIESTDLYDIIKVMKELKESYGVQITYNIGLLPRGNKGKMFRYIGNGVDIRKYLFAHIVLRGKNLYLVEVERQGKSLATLVLHSMDYQVVHEIEKYTYDILKALVNNSGSWNNEAIITTVLEDERLRHYKAKDYDELASKYYERLENL